MLRNMGMNVKGSPGELQSEPYNFLMTRSWMLLLPRTHEFFHTISLNSLAFVGALLVRNKTEMELLKAAGPLKALRSVTKPI